MKVLVYVTALLLIFPGYSMADDQDASNDGLLVKSEQKSIFKGLLYRVWGKLRALSPSSHNNSRSRAVVTAGVRGAETTESVISPYWMGDKTNDPDYIRELEEYTQAQQLAENGDLQGAVKALAAFIDSHEDSDLKPNAQFALGISYGGLGQNQPSIDALEVFVKDHPSHPLVADARQVIAELK